MALDYRQLSEPSSNADRVNSSPSGTSLGRQPRAEEADRLAVDDGCPLAPAFRAQVASKRRVEVVQPFSHGETRRRKLCIGRSYMGSERYASGRAHA
jgi:hypothetical protein